MLTNLEAAAVGEVLNSEPCTAHFIRTCFRDSLAKHFSDSSGSVYPMMKRLEKQGILKSTRAKEGRRFVRQYRVTPEGRAALRNWLGPPVPDESLISNDPLRTRFLYLHRLSKPKRVKWITETEKAIRDKLAEVQLQKKRVSEKLPDSIYQLLAIENGVIELEARLNWLAVARKQLAKSDQI